MSTFFIERKKNIRNGLLFINFLQNSLRNLSKKKTHRKSLLSINIKLKNLISIWSLKNRLTVAIYLYEIFKQHVFKQY